MDSLLAEMRDLEGRTGPVQSPPVAQLAAEEHAGCWAGIDNKHSLYCNNNNDDNEESVNSWAEQYLESGRNFQVLKKYCCIFLNAFVINK